MARQISLVAASSCANERLVQQAFLELLEQTVLAEQALRLLATRCQLVEICAGGPVTVTYPEISCFIMTTAEAAELVIQARATAAGGEAFVSDLGGPIELVEVACQTIQLMGLPVREEQSPGGDIAIEFTGLHPGEKLHK